MTTPTAATPDDGMSEWVREKQLLARIPVSRAWLYEVRNESWLRFAILKRRRSNIRGIVLYHLPTILAHLDRLANGDERDADEQDNANPSLPEGGAK